MTIKIAQVAEITMAMIRSDASWDAQKRLGCLSIRPPTCRPSKLEGSDELLLFVPFEPTLSVRQGSGSGTTFPLTIHDTAT